MKARSWRRRLCLLVTIVGAAACAAPTDDVDVGSDPEQTGQTDLALRTADTQGCMIDRVKYAAGTRNPANLCQSCQPSVSRKAWVDVVNGTVCDDGNACTQTDTCQSGACVGNNPVVCTASDQCHAAGSCDPGTGACSNPTAAEGAICDDGNACTRTDTCESGSCVGKDAVVCTAIDACHVAGACHPLTGTCSTPQAPDGTTCSDGSACTQGDSCRVGVCRGAYVVSAACPEIAVTTPTVTPVNANACLYKWTSSVENHSAATSPAYTIQAIQGAEGAGGTSVAPIAAGQTVTKSLNFELVGAPSLYVNLLQNVGGVWTVVASTSSVPLPQRPPVQSLTLGGIQPTTTTTYRFTVKNLSTTAFPLGDDLTPPATRGGVQTYSSTSASGPWTVAGGEAMFGCIAPNGEWVNKTTATKPSDHRYVRLVLDMGSTILDDKIFDSVTGSEISAPIP